MKKVVVGIITYNRNELLLKALRSFVQSEGLSEMNISLVVVDNYKDNHAKEILSSVNLPFNGVYLFEKEQGIPFARNAVVDKAIDLEADYLAFFDDDEEVDPLWLRELTRFHIKHGHEVSIGRVESIYSDSVASWVRESDFFERKRSDTGRMMRYAATSNILYDMKIFTDWNLRFDERFALSGGTDNYLAAEILVKKGIILYCDEASVSEIVPAHRAQLGWILKRIYRSRANDVTYFRILHKSHCKYFTLTLKKTTEELFLSFRYFFLFVCTFNSMNIVKSIFSLVSILGYISGLVGLRYNEYKKPI